MSDFIKASTASERATVASEIAVLEGWLKRSGVSRGDELLLDWVPGAGMTATRNGTPLSAKPIQSELMFSIVLRIFIGPEANATTRSRLLGLQPR
jgi:hypothetical protein